MTPFFKDFVKGSLWIFFILGLWGILAPQARAGTERELMKLLEGRRTVYVGTCHLTKDGKFAEAEKDYTVHRCIVGVYDREPGEIYYVLIVDGQGNGLKLIVVNKDAKEQSIVWTKGTMT